ncbi:MAG: hypothetical protein ACRD3Q_13040 [Terriglobales bacterium]
MFLHGRTWRYLAILLVSGSFAWADNQAPTPELPKDPNQFVRQVITNELKQERTSQLFTFTTVQKKADRTETKQIVQTKAGSIGRLILVNGKPLTADQREKEDARLQRLVADPSAMAAKKKDQDADEKRSREMVKAMPDAFLYQYAGTENKQPWGEIAVLKFKPNPNFDPPNQETKVYRGMEGEMWIDLKEMRLAKIDAKLFKEVAFGWGVLGHLDPGGAFLVEQQPVYGNHWDATHMILNFTGKILMFKTLKIRDNEITENYRPVSDMSVAGALDFLRKTEIEMAQNAAAK